MGNINEHFIRRLSFAKFLFLRARQERGMDSGVSRGEIVLRLQDATEMALLTLAEISNVALDERDGFEKMMTKLSDKTGKVIPNRVGLTQMNKTRVNFKHHALVPDRNDVEKQIQDVEGFFKSALPEFAGVSYETIGLLELVENSWCRLYLPQAQKAVDEGGVRDSLMSSAKAFYALMVGQNRPERHRDRWLELDGEFGEAIERGMRGLVAAVGLLTVEIDVLMYGIDLYDYHMFRYYTPTMERTHSGGWYQHYSTIEHVASIDAARFCIQFVVEAALQIEARPLPQTGWLGNWWTKEYRVTQECDVLVEYAYAEKGSIPFESIRKAAVGEILLGSSTSRDEYIEISQDNLAAYVRRGCVEEVDSKADPQSSGS